MKIGIIGLGLIGGSILKALREKGFDVVAITSTSSTIEKAKFYTPFVYQEIEYLKDCDVVFVCVPMNNVLDTLDRLNEVLSENVIVSDVSSLKAFVTGKKYNYKFVGTHPMAGTEHSGFDSSFKDLFVGAKWVITNDESTDSSALWTLEHLVEKMGAQVVYANALEHDKAVAKISHMPMLLAQALFESVKDDELALKLASSGFRDMTRLAMSNVDMAQDMINLNSENINNSLEEVFEHCNKLQENYKEKISEIKQQRAEMYDKDGKNIL